MQPGFSRFARCANRDPNRDAEGQEKPDRERSLTICGYSRLHFRFPGLLLTAPWNPGLDPELMHAHACIWPPQQINHIYRETFSFLYPVFAGEKRRVPRINPSALIALNLFPGLSSKSRFAFGTSQKWHHTVKESSERCGFFWRGREKETRNGDVNITLL